MASERAFELVVFSGEDVRRFPLPRAGEVTIGRDEGSGVRIDDPSVSRRHALLRVGERLEVEDLGGANGTFVRKRAEPGGTAAGSVTLDVSVRQLVSRSAELFVGDCLMFGTTSVAVRHVPRLDLPDLASAEDSGAGGSPGVIVRDPAMRVLYAQVARAARSNISVLLLGETGVGKEILARAIHAHSPRAKGPFVAINCAALAPSLLESELFGSEKGAFTGSAGARAGLFEAAEGGTVFLDEIAEMPLDLQPKLLRVIEERTVMRLGSTRLRPVDVRFVAATNREIGDGAREGARLRSDLYFRLSGIALSIPPLRERPLEIEALAASFLVAACRDLERVPPPAISGGAMELLRRHAWPGNVRELRNAMERAAVLCAESEILPDHLPPSLRAARAGVAAPSSTSPSSHAAEMKSIEQTKILEALERCGGNQSEAARLLGMPRRTLVTRLGELGLTRPRRPQ